MAKGMKLSLIFIIIISVLIGSSLFLIKIQNRVRENPPGTIGNTAGNLQNGGLFCESDGIVYFSNPYDNNYLYSMNADETDCKRINTSMVRFINAGVDEIYYYQYDSYSSEEYGFISHLGGLFRSPKKGGRTVCLKKNTIGTVLLVDNTLYYLNYEGNGNYNLNSITTAKKEDQRILDGIADPSCYSDGYLYYVLQDSTQNHYLNSYHLKTGTQTIVYTKDIWYPQAHGSYIYFLDVHNDYRLCRYEPATGVYEQLTDERIECYNLCGDYIYYQVNSSVEPYLGMMKTDGSMQTKLIGGNYTNINCTSNYVYFMPFGSDSVMYHAPIGSTYISDFTVPLDAMKKYYKD